MLRLNPGYVFVCLRVCLLDTEGSFVAERASEIGTRSHMLDCLFVCLYVCLFVYVCIFTYGLYLRALCVSYLLLSFAQQATWSLTSKRCVL